EKGFPRGSFPPKNDRTRVPGAIFFIFFRALYKKLLTAVHKNSIINLFIVYKLIPGEAHRRIDTLQERKSTEKDAPELVKG
ncbi:MAG: hypothetical protein II739_06220, partial [Clostridia bacterium]|nr:hypothetical protein [Clostridia bacterium]